MSDESDKRELWLTAQKAYLCVFLGLLDRHRKIGSLKLSASETRTFMRTLKTAASLSGRAAETSRAAASAELYEQLAATADRTRRP